MEEQVDRNPVHELDQRRDLANEQIVKDDQNNEFLKNLELEKGFCCLVSGIQVSAYNCTA